MWNHSSEMDAAMSNRGLRWPELSERDVADLLRFLSSLSTTNNEAPEFSVGEPEQGRLVFDRSCESCHSFGDKGSSKVDLLGKSSPDSVIGYVAAMWNHAPSMRRRGGSTVKLNRGEMRDLVAYLFSQYYFFEQGNPSNGRRVYEAKLCGKCHEQPRAVPGAPALDQATEVYSPITLTAAAWRHGPSMLRAMKQQGIPWPEFRGSEMKDLIAYLNSRLISRIGSKGD
jgi:cytochrome c2